MTFQPQPHVLIPRDLAVLQQDAGGRFGRLTFGGATLSNVLQVTENTYITSEKVKPEWDAAAAMVGAVIHDGQRPADQVQFIQRMKEFRREESKRP